MTSIQCAICGNKEKLKLRYKAQLNKRKISSQTFSARRTPDRTHYRFMECLNCGLIFSNPIFSNKEITKLYKDSIFDYGIESEFLRKTYANHLHKAINNRNIKKISLLDIGCGNGFFLDEVKEMGVNSIAGVEPGRDTVDRASNKVKKYIKIDVFKKNLFENNSFDIICCFHTLDHIVDVNNFINSVYKLLKPGGRVYFVVHDTDGLSVKLFGEKSPIFDIEHIYLFNKKTLIKLFTKHKFYNEDTFSIKNKYPISYWIRMSPMPKMLKSLILGTFSFFKLSNIPLSLSAGNIGIVAEK